jgi:hypothetical protein
LRQQDDKRKPTTCSRARANLDDPLGARRVQLEECKDLKKWP